MTTRIYAPWLAELTMQIKVPDYDASPRQALFHTSTAYETLYGGAAGGGKTAALCAEAVTTCLQYPGIRVYVFRNTIPELKATIIPEVRRQCAAYMDTGALHYHGLDRQFRFDNGSIIQLAYMEHPGDEFNYQGAEIQLLMFDELTHFTQDQYEYLKTRVRTTGNYPLRIMSATNPGNIGHGWVKSYFIDGKEPEKVYTDKDTGQSRIFIPAKVSDHPLEKFKHDYRKSLEAIADTDLRRALLEGDWDVFSGQVFTEWRREKHIVDPFPIEDHWQRWSGYDWGYGNPATMLWLARDPSTNRVYVYKEFYATGMTVTQQAQKIKLIEGQDHVMPRLADPSIWKSKVNIEDGETIANLFMREGLTFVPANNERLAGKNAIHEALAPLPLDGKPKLQVFSNCYNLIRTLPSLPYDQHKPEDVDTDAEDHAYDALRYALMNARKPKRKDDEVPKPPGFDMAGNYGVRI